MAFANVVRAGSGASDAALFDADDQLWVTGRLDDVINVAGYRLGTMELEAALLKHASVSEAAVVTQHDDVKGEVPVAFAGSARWQF